jgi:acyl-coenzyme A thioesterase PaaI-like protein
MDREYTHTTNGCFGCGLENDAGLGLRPYKDGEGLAAEFRPKPHHRGFSRVVHGGIVAAVLDEVITTAVAVASGSLLATVSLDVRYEAPMPTGGEFVVRAKRTGDEGSRYTGEGVVTDGDGRTIARARASFLPLTPERAKRFKE